MVTIDTIGAGDRAIESGSQAIVARKRVWGKLLAALRLWRRRRRTRIHLADLTLEELRDVGITPDEARREIGRSYLLPIERPMQPPF